MTPSPYVSQRASHLLNQREPCFVSFSRCLVQLGSPSWREDGSTVPAGVSSAGLPLLQAPWVPVQRCQGGTHQERRRNPGRGHRSLCSAHYPFPQPALVSGKSENAARNPFQNDSLLSLQERLQLPIRNSPSKGGLCAQPRCSHTLNRVSLFSTGHQTT